MYKIIVKHDIKKNLVHRKHNFGFIFVSWIDSYCKGPDLANISTIYLNNDEDIHYPQRSAI